MNANLIILIKAGNVTLLGVVGTIFPSEMPYVLKDSISFKLRSILPQF